MQPSHKKKEEPASPSSVQYAQLTQVDENIKKAKLYSGKGRRNEENPESMQAYGQLKSNSPLPPPSVIQMSNKSNFQQVTNFTGINIRRN